jgi:hypothetical protein
MMYTNLPINKPASSSDATLKNFNNYNTTPLQLNNNVLIAMMGILETRGWLTETAENISIAILTQAKKDGYNAMAILESIKGLGQTDLNALVAEILNNNRYKTSSLGVIQTVIPVDNVKRNILA